MPSVFCEEKHEYFNERYTYIPTIILLDNLKSEGFQGNDSNLLIVFYVQIMPDDLVMQLHRF